MDKNSLKIALEVQDGLLELQRKVQEIIRVLSIGGTSGSGDTVAPPAAGTPGRKWLTLYDLKEGEYRRSKPELVLCPGREPERVSTWKEVMLKIVAWHVEAGRIVADTPPKTARRKPVVSKEKGAISQTHGDSKSYIASVGEWWVDTWGNVETKARNLIAVCTHSGTDPKEFKVSLVPRSSGVG